MNTASDLNKINERNAEVLKRKNWTLDNEAGVKRLADAVIVGDEVKKNSCFGAAVSVLALVGTVAAAVAMLGSGNIKLGRMS
jgi:hypothetical protein